MKKKKILKGYFEQIGLGVLRVLKIWVVVKNYWYSLSIMNQKQRKKKGLTPRFELKEKPREKKKKKADEERKKEFRNVNALVEKI